MNMWLEVVSHAGMVSGQWQGGWGTEFPVFQFVGIAISMFSRDGFLSRNPLGDPAVSLLVQVLSPLPLCTSPSSCGFSNIYEKNLLLPSFPGDSETVILPCWDLLCCTGPVRSCCVRQSWLKNVFFFLIIPIFYWNLKKLISCLRSLSPVDFLLWMCTYQKIKSKRMCSPNSWAFFAFSNNPSLSAPKQILQMVV